MRITCFSGTQLRLKGKKISTQFDFWFKHNNVDNFFWVDKSYLRAYAYKLYKSFKLNFLRILHSHFIKCKLIHFPLTKYSRDKTHLYSHKNVVQLKPVFLTFWSKHVQLTMRFRHLYQKFTDYDIHKLKPIFCHIHNEKLIKAQIQNDPNKPVTSHAHFTNN